VKSNPEDCSDDTVARARQGALTPAEWRGFAIHLAACASCRITWRLMTDFEQSAAVRPRDELIIGRAAEAALAGLHHRRSHAIRVAAAAAVVLLIAGAASGAVILRVRHLADIAERSQAARPGSAKSRGPATPLAARPAAEEPAVSAAPEPSPSSPPAPQSPAPLTRPAPFPSPAAERTAGAESLVAASAPNRPISRRASSRPEDASALFARAVREREQGRASAAIATFRSLQRRFPQTPQALLSLVSLAVLSLDSGDAGAALTAFDAYLAAAPSGTLVPEALLGKARALAALDRRAEAEAVLRELARGYPDSPYARQSIGKHTGGQPP
jgi:TolA-binding protein